MAIVYTEAGRPKNKKGVAVKLLHPSHYQLMMGGDYRVSVNLVLELSLLYFLFNVSFQRICFTSIIFPA